MTALINGFSLWLADYQLLAAVLLALALAAAAAMRQPVRRMAVFKGALAALMALAILCSLPGWSVIHLLHSETTLNGSPREMVDAQTARHSATPFIRPQLPVEPIPSPEPQSSSRAVRVLPAEPQPLELRWDLVTAGYLVGSLLVTLWLAAGGLYAYRLRAGASPAPAELQQLLRQIIGTARPPELLISARVKTPVALGLLRPAIILPAAMVDVSSLVDKPRSPRPEPHDDSARGEQQRETAALTPILAHEWAHLQNSDLHTLVASRLLLALLWPQPLYWLLRRRLRLDQETLADAAAAELGGRVQYAEQLLGWARDLPRAYASRLEAAVGLWEGPSQLKRRIAILLNERFAVMRLCPRRWRVGSAGVALAVAIGLSLTTLQSGEPSAAAQQASRHRQGGEPQSSAELKEPPPVEAEDIRQSAPNGAQSLRAAHERLNRSKLVPNTVVGMCLDDKGHPIAGARVSLYHCVTDHAPELITTAPAGANGWFEFVDVVDAAKVFPEGVPDPLFETGPRALVGVLVDAPGRAYEAHLEMAVQVLRHGVKKLLVVQPSATLSGVVTGPGGNPVENATVLAGYDVLPGSGLSTVRSDAEGRYKIERLSPWDGKEQRKWFEAETKRLRQAGREDQFFASSASGWLPEYPLTVRHPDYAVKRATVEKVPGEADVQLQPGAVIQGRVLFQENGQSRPAGRLTVRVTRENHEDDETSAEAPRQVTFTMIQQETAQTDAEGRYRVPSLPPGQYSITAVAEGWVTRGLQGIAVKRGETATAPELTLTRGAVVRVQLVDDQTHKPSSLKEGQRGFVHPIPLPRGQFHMPVIDDPVVSFSAEGRAEIRIPPGRYAFYVSIPTGDFEQPYWQSAGLEDDGDVAGLTVVEGESPLVTIEMAK